MHTHECAHTHTLHFPMDAALLLSCPYMHPTCENERSVEGTTGREGQERSTTRPLWCSPPPVPSIERVIGVICSAATNCVNPAGARRYASRIYTHTRARALVRLPVPTIINGSTMRHYYVNHKLATSRAGSSACCAFPYLAEWRLDGGVGVRRVWSNETGGRERRRESSRLL